MTRLFRRLRRGIKRASGALVGAFAIGVLKMVRAVDPDKMADFTGWMMSRIGPLLPESRIGRANLAVAFPENPKPKSTQSCAGVGTIWAEWVRSLRTSTDCGAMTANSRHEVALTLHNPTSSVFTSYWTTASRH